MKTTITIFAVAAFFTACNSNPKPVETAKIPQEDTAGLAEFKSQKELQEKDELIQTEGIYDGTNNASGVAAAPAPARRAVSSAPSRRSTTSRPARSSSSTGNGTINNGGGSGTAQAPAPAKKEGWSKAAKGAVIGGASGAVVGAVVSKKKGKGAIIGGILGAGGGYVIGRSKDKKDGRVQ